MNIADFEIQAHVAALRAELAGFEGTAHALRQIAVGFSEDVAAPLGSVARSEWACFPEVLTLPGTGTDLPD